MELDLDRILIFKPAIENSAPNLWFLSIILVFYYLSLFLFRLYGFKYILLTKIYYLLNRKDEYFSCWI